MFDYIVTLIITRPRACIIDDWKMMWLRQKTKRTRSVSDSHDNRSHLAMLKTLNLQDAKSVSTSNLELHGGLTPKMQKDANKSRSYVDLRDKRSFVSDNEGHPETCERSQSLDLQPVKPVVHVCVQTEDTDTKGRKVKVKRGNSARYTRSISDTRDNRQHVVMLQHLRTLSEPHPGSTNQLDVEYEMIEEEDDTEIDQKNDNVFFKNGIRWPHIPGWKKKRSVSFCTPDPPPQIQVCHHTDCQDRNGHQPLMLCSDCDSDIHSHADHRGHLRFDVFRKGSNLTRNVSTRSLPDSEPTRRSGRHSDGEEDEDNEAEHKEEEDEHGTEIDFDDIKKNTRIKRKKAVKGRRHHTDKKRPLYYIKDVGFKGSSPKSHWYDEQDFQRALSNPEGPTYKEGSREGLDDIMAHLNHGMDEIDSEGIPRQINFEQAPLLEGNNLPVHRHYSDEGMVSWQHQKQMQTRSSNHSMSEVEKYMPRREPLRKKYSLGMEYFTLKFDLLEKPEVEIVGAVKGKSLKDALLPVMERRGIRMDRVNIFVASSKTPLPVACDTFALGGNHLHVRAKDGDSPFSRVMGSYNRSGSTSTSSSTRSKASLTKEREKEKLEKKQSGSQSQRSKRSVQEDNLSDTSPAGTLTSGDSQKLKGLRTQSKLSTIFNPFVKSQEKQELLSEHLNRFSLDGLPPMPDLLTIGRPQFDDSVFEMENHWTDVVDGSETMSKKQKDHQEAIWEILQTEVEYIKKLKVITDVFICVLLNLQNEQVLNEIETEKVFSNITEVSQVNAVFWHDYMRKVLLHARETREPLNPSLMKEGFLQFDEQFHPYVKYCLDQESCLEYIKSKLSQNELFRTFVMWAEAQKQCNRLKLTDRVVSPMQRLTRYKLLLKAILKKSESEEQRKDLVQMIEKVERFVLHVNTAMHQRQEQARLSMIINRIESYDVIEAVNDECLKLVYDFCQLDLTKPIPGCGHHQKRNLLLEGSLKMKDSVSKMDVYCFLFTDMLLVTKPNKRGDKVKVIRPPMRLDKIIVHPLRDGASFFLVYLNEYHLATAAYTLHGDAKIWVDHIRKTQDVYKQARQAAMERPERSLLYLEGLDDPEDEFNFYSYPQPHGDVFPEPVSRTDSVSSAENFVPSMPRSVSQEAVNSRLSVPDMEHHRRSFTSSGSLEEGYMHGQHEALPKRPRSATLTEGRSRSPRSHSVIEKRSSHGDEYDSYLLSPSKGDQGASPNISPKLMQKQIAHEAFIAKPVPVRPKPGSRHESQSSLDGFGPPHSTKPGLVGLPNPPDLTFVDENLRSKLNQRRTSREKRYHTADAIQDMRKDKDASIHKRLSWNFGTAVDINIDEKSDILKGKTFSCDSLRSMPSSSGVSSTGSLHLSPESEICEEYDPSMCDIDNFVDELDPRSNSQKDSRLLLDAINKANRGVQVNSTQNIEQQRKNISKSMPDISRLGELAAGEIKDGIASVDLPEHEDGDQNIPQRRKMTHAQIMRMKKQLLLNSTLEASEV